VPAGASRKPELKSWITRATYASSSEVHFPRRSEETCLLLLFQEPLEEAVEVGELAWAIEGMSGGALIEGMPRGALIEGMPGGALPAREEEGVSC
jgi:hypothetical protein